MSPVAMALLLVGGFGLFALSALRRWRLLFAGGTRQPARLTDWRVRWTRLLLDGLLQARLRQYTWAGWAHSLIFFGFMLLLARTIILWGRGFEPNFDLWILGRTPLLNCQLGMLYSTLKDCCSGGVLLAVAFFLVQRLCWRPKRLNLSKEGVLILLVIAALMIADVLYDGASLVVANVWKRDCYSVSSAGCLEAAKYAAGVDWPMARIEWRAVPDPLGSLMAIGLQGLGLHTLLGLANFGFWTHSVLVVLFLNLLPYSKHFHILTALPNLLLASTSQAGKLDKIADSAEELLERADLLQSPDQLGKVPFGIARIDDLTWKDRLDLYSCTECGRCSEHCPAHRTGKPLSPKQLTLDLRHALFREAPRLFGIRNHAPGDTNEPGTLQQDSQLIPITLNPETIWSCTACRACEQQCPVNISYVDKIVGMRRDLVLMRGEVPSELQRCFEGMERNGNPWNLARKGRSDWSLGLNVRRIKDVSRVDVLYWVGCAASYDGRAKRVARALISLMHQAQVDFAILGDEETCTGDAARRAGNEYLFLQLAQANVATLNRYYLEKRFERIVTACPHCLTTLKNEYPDFGGSWPILHHSKFLLDLVQSGRLHPDESRLKSIVFHDPCTLARYENDVISPRRLLRNLPHVSLIEPEHSGKFTLCCGAGGSRMWMDEDPKSRMNEARSRELLATGAEGIVTACPFCTTMIGDGVAQIGSNQDVEVLDIAEVLAAAGPN